MCLALSSSYTLVYVSLPRLCTFHANVRYWWKSLQTRQLTKGHSFVLQARTNLYLLSQVASLVLSPYRCNINLWSEKVWLKKVAIKGEKEARQEAIRSRFVFRYCKNAFSPFISSEKMHLTPFCYAFSLSSSEFCFFNFPPFLRDKRVDRNLGPYSQHFIFFITYKLVQ